MKQLLLAALVLSATPALSEPASRADKAAVLAWATNALADPYSLRSTAISDVVPVKGVLVVCVQYNAKSPAGGYVGVDRHPFEWTSRGLIPAERSSRVDTATCYQPQVVMKPFPELASIK